MAVPQNKKSHSRTRMRRSRARLRKPTLTLEKGGEGEIRRRHHIGDDGFYRGVQYFEPKTDIVEDDEE